MKRYCTKYSLFYKNNSAHLNYGQNYINRYNSYFFTGIASMRA